MSKITLYYGVRLYSNRIINEDLTKATASYSFDNINFIQGDGINAELTLNNVPTDDSPSYLIVDGKQCWFVLSCYKQNAKQVTLLLRRDFLSEKWDLLKNQDFICRKAATIPGFVSYAKYSKTMNLSQVKKREWLLNNDDGKGWIVVYFNRDTSGNKDTSSTPDPWGNGNVDITAEDGTLKVTLSKNHTQCYSSPCDVLAIPIGGTMHFTDGGSDENIGLYDVNTAMSLIYGISLHFGSIIVDIQYLPYVLSDRSVDSHTGTDYTKFSWIERKISDSNWKRVGWAIWQRQAYFTKNISDNSFSKQTLPPDNLEQRKFNEEKMYRLCSPNFASSFEFSPVRNGGFPTFTVHGVLRPLNPYIYVEPDFNPQGLYGGTYDDGRGLILSGDFSLDQVSNAWANYKLQNKNYELIFNRQIQSMDLKNSIAEEQANWNIAGSYVNAAAGTASGTLAGFLAGGPAGAVVGGIASAAGGAANIVQSYRSKDWTKELNNDARSAAIDNFQYQIGNIKALPNTLTKVSAITQDFKIFPIIEEYRCTGNEADNLNFSILYNGIDIDEICQLSDFSHGFVSGMIPVFPKTLNINQQQADTINYELSAGIYIKEV